jgi:hypothetical protein
MKYKFICKKLSSYALPELVPTCLMDLHRVHDQISFRGAAALHLPTPTCGGDGRYWPPKAKKDGFPMAFFSNLPQQRYMF